MGGSPRVEVSLSEESPGDTAREKKGGRSEKLKKELEKSNSTTG